MANSLPRLTTALSDTYRIERELGAGGMATVYLAEDLKHKRKVALKVLKPELAAVLGAERFVQEITTTAALQHPHILPLFDSGTADGFLYYVMPFIDGETLRAKLNRETQLGIEEAVRIATHVADALDYAHRHGVIHRDIKPENILLHDGRPMVADFGIALAVSAAAGGRMTETGLSLGTPHYMSPEQATAEKELTARSDVYSLGSVLYEMLTGSPPHVGASAQQIIMKIVTEEAAPVTKLRKAVPPNVAAAVAQSLEKLPADRFGSAAELAAALQNRAFTTVAETSAVLGRDGMDGFMPSVRMKWAWAAGLMAISSVAGWMLHQGRGSEAAPFTRVAVPVPGGHEMVGFLPNLAVSADGRTLAYFSDGVLYKRRLERDDPEPLGRFERACCPEFSRDGGAVRFLGLSLGTDLWSIPIEGGSAVDLSRRPIGEDIVSGSWSQSGLLRRRAGDTAWTVITALDSGGAEAAHLWPQLLQDGRSVLFTILGPSMMWHDAKIVVQDLASGERTTVVNEGTYGRYIPTGHVVYIRADGTVEALPFDLERRRAVGSPFAVERGVRTGYWAGAGSFAISEAGTFAFTRGSSWQQHRLTWVDRQGKVLGHVGQPVTAEGVRLSPDERYAVTYVASPSADIARFDIATGEQRRLTFDIQTEDNPLWSPDGRRVTYRRIVSASDNRIVTRSADGQGAVEQVYAGTGGSAIPLSWSPDGAALAFNHSGTLVLHVQSGRVDTVSRNGGYAQFSPDGRWLAYTAPESGRDEVYAISYPRLTGRQQISVSGGRLPLWSARSGELFFVNGDTLMETSVSTGSGLDWTTPKPLFASPDLATLDYTFSVSADGRRFLYPTRNPDAAAREIRVVLNWFEELKAKARP